ncbi:TIGR00341 family protein [Halomicroarcula sp. GCM10025817]|uniref:TIGR00341 family protein n=1 Tax=Haloarcula TaxID=2237 RepID=UPI0023E77920|nr:TIGR00341 family protein [Halomicroarcula sp. SYNS111]
MRLIQVRTAADELEDVRSVLEDRDVRYVLTEEQSADGPAMLVQFPLPPEAVDEVFEALHDVGIDRDGYAVVARAEMATPDQSAAAERHDDRISHEELRSRAVGMSPGPVTYYAMTVLSAVVATAGLLLDSPAIVVGSMVIAPQVGSALTASVGTALNDRALVVDGLRDQVLGLGVAVAGAAAFGLLVRHGGVVPGQLRVTTVQQIAQRISPGFLSMVVGVCAGGAGAIGLATALPVSLVGVMIAAALIPAAAAVGVGIAWNIPAVALGAGILLLVNVAAVNLTGFLVLWALGFRPATWSEGWPDRETVRTHAPTLLAVLVLATAFVGATTVTAEQMHVETTVNGAVQDVLEDETYERLRLQSVRTRFGGVSVYRLDREVTVTVSRPDGAQYPRLADRLERAVSRALDGEEVAVEVTFVSRQSSST